MNKEYLDEIKRKLDRMNSESGIDPSKMANSKKVKDPDAIDIFDALGRSAIAYMEKKKREQENNN